MNNTVGCKLKEGERAAWHLPLRLVTNHDGSATPSYINVMGFGPSM
jgi:hypothetical protein